ncbi:MAG TPA: MogA/MoaB family molybdenum cofactor biosynthesis protein [Acidimicrobiia bacterium]|jgi:molybdenum cofactor biosynthesis protein B
MRAAVVTVSDRVSRGEAADRSGPAAEEALRTIGFEITSTAVVPDGVESVAAALRGLIGKADLVVTTGGTGFTDRDLTPEATRLVIEREAPGLAEAMRAATFGVNPHGMLSRGVAGIAGSTLILNLPGSVSGVTESLAVIAEALPHAVELLTLQRSDHNVS